MSKESRIIIGPGSTNGHTGKAIRRIVGAYACGRPPGEDTSRMIPVNPSNKSTTQMENMVETAEEQPEMAVTSQSWIRRIGQAIKNYPVPLGSLVLLLISLFFWLTGNSHSCQLDPAGNRHNGRYSTTLGYHQTYYPQGI